jgi:hypothetical protein
MASEPLRKDFRSQADYVAALKAYRENEGKNAEAGATQAKAALAAAEGQNALAAAAAEKTKTETATAAEKARADLEAKKAADAQATAERNALATYHNDPTGQNMAALKTGPAFLLGMPMGRLEADTIGRTITGATRGVANRLGPVSGNILGRGAMGIAQGAGVLGDLYKSNEFKNMANAPHATGWEQDNDQLWENAALGAAVTNFGHGAAWTFKDALHPDNDTPPKPTPAPPAEPTPPPQEPEPTPLTEDQKKLKAGAKALGVEGDLSPADAKAYIEGRRAGGLSAEQSTALRNALGDAVKSASHTTASALKRLTPGALGAATFAGLEGGDAASNAARAAGVEPGSAADRAAPVAGGLASGAAGYGAYKLGEKALEAFPAAARVAGVAARALTPLGEAYTAYDLLSRVPDFAAPREQTPQTEAAVGNNFTDAGAELSRQRLEQLNALARSRPQPQPGAPMQAPPGSSLQRFTNPTAAMASQDPKFKAALDELIAAHGGRN